MSETADALVVFGITGDLARTKSLPALYDLVEQGILICPVIGVGRRPLREDELREHARAAIEAAKGDGLDRRVLDTFLSRLSYVGGDAMDDALYEQLEKALGNAQRPVFYLAIPPAAFLESSEHLARAGLLDNARLVVEKPFGTRSRLRARAEPAPDRARAGGAPVPHRPLPRQGARAGHHVPAVLQCAVRARVEP